MLLTHTADIRWLTGFNKVFDREQAHCALILRDSARENACLFTDMRYSGSFRLLDTQGCWRIFDQQRRRFPYIAEVLNESLDAASKSKPLVIGIESDLRLDWYRALETALDELTDFTYELKEMPDFITGLRAKKSAEEIVLLRGAQAITDAAYIHMLNYLKPGLTEKETALELELFMRRAGADGVAFPSIVAGGPNSALPHAVPRDRAFQHGDIVLMDFGAKLNDYRSDMTRVVVLGEASEQQKAMHAATLAAQSAVIEKLKPGMKGCEAQRIAEDVIAEYGFAGKFIHSLGHGVGIDIHELPLLAEKAEEPLAPGHVVTVEPGVYLEGVGGVRIENFGVITETGFEDFTQSSRELFVL
jgi:Xaa-Pro aminopeptidase